MKNRKEALRLYHAAPKLKGRELAVIGEPLPVQQEGDRNDKTRVITNNGSYLLPYLVYHFSRAKFWGWS